MKSLSKLIIAVAISAIAQSIFAASACPENYAGGQPPQLINPKLAQGFVELCAQGGVFATGYSKLTRDPLYSAEHITAEHMTERSGRGRENSFRPDDRLSHNERAELEDFRRSGFDRGHLASDADSWSDETENATYNLSNMIPQAPRNNRGLHAHIEMTVRHFAKKVGDVYTITGPIFDGSNIAWLNNRVAIPTRIFKLVYLPSRNEAAAYLEVNSNGPEGQEYTQISLQELNQLTGMNMLPGLRNVGLLKLPKPSGKGVIGE